MRNPEQFHFGLESLGRSVIGGTNGRTKEESCHTAAGLRPSGTGAVCPRTITERLEEQG